jgi:hypothetical protein
MFLDEFEASASCWATMAKTFFKMSFWRRKVANSRCTAANSTAVATATPAP